MQVSMFICAYEQGKTNGYIPAEWPSYLMNNPQPQAITSFAISLLLVSLAAGHEGTSGMWLHVIHGGHPLLWRRHPVMLASEQ
jgi:hypothetical protein